ncbi:MAG TPA: DUF3035 domain-containing protein [Alphaproteobacteria bacterium]|nr:DUF3035 domain-containing protein [Alphaproteobacteria bacterium]
MLRSMILACGAAVALAGCSAVSDVKSLVQKGNKDGNEYRAVRNQPLVVPPGFDLRPPRGGGSAGRGGRSTTIRARRAVIGGGGGGTATLPGTGERALVRKAASGVSGAGSYVRKEVDQETKKNKESERKFTDKLLKWENREGASDRKNPLGGNTDPVIKRKGQIF